MKITVEHRQKLAVDLLRFSLAAVFLYAAIASLMYPQNWIGYLPSFAKEMVDGELLLKFFSVYEVALALWLISGKYLQYAGLVAAATLAGIVVANPKQFLITFRDVALIFSSLALVVLVMPAKRDGQ